MKLVINAIFFATILTLCFATARAADPAPVAKVSPEGLPEGYVNVMDYITQVGNKTNHTEAIRMAFKDTSRKTAPNGVGGRHFAVYFPPGNYVISEPIEDMGYTKIIGNNATITQTNPEKDIFTATSNGSYFPYIQGLSFIGGRNQIYIDSGTPLFIRIIDCNFRKASGTAIYLHTGSAHAIIERGYIDDCQRMMDIALDSVVIRGFHGRSLLETNAAAFVLGCVIAKMEDCLWTPHAKHGDARWIDNHSGKLILKDTRFGGESGGFCPVVNYTKFGVVSEIIIDGCLLCGMSTDRKAVVFCEEVPSVICIRNSSIYGIAPIMVSKKIDLRNYFTEETTLLHPSFRIEDSTGYIGDIPELLKNPVIRRVEKTFLDDGKIEELMAAAVKGVGAMNTSPGEVEKPVEGKEQISGAKHTEQTDPSKYMPVSFKQCAPTGNADSEIIPNAHYFAVRPVGENLIIMKRQFKTGNAWISLPGFKVDLDKYPLLSRKIKSVSSYRIKSQGSYPPIRIRDRESGQKTQLGDSFQKYAVIDLRKVFGGGVHTLDLELYWSGQWMFRGPRETIEMKDIKECFKDIKDLDEVLKECQCHLEGSYLMGLPPPGTYMVYDYIRAEAE